MPYRPTQWFGEKAGQDGEGSEKRVPGRIGLVSVCDSRRSATCGRRVQVTRYRGSGRLAIELWRRAVFLDFFQNIDQHCGAGPQENIDYTQLGEKSVAIFGVRSTSLGSWVARSRRGKAAVCEVDKKWKANAATFGTVNTGKNKYVQIGKDGTISFARKANHRLRRCLPKAITRPR